MELSIGPPSQHVTWKVRDFFELPSDIGYFVDSPEIRFAGDSYCLRLYPNGDRTYQDGIQTEIMLERLTSTFSERKVSCDVGFRWKNKQLEEFDTYFTLTTITYSVLYSRSIIDESRDIWAPDGTFTAVCSMRLGEQNNSECPQSEKCETCGTETAKEGLSGESHFSSCWKSSKMELSIESPWRNVEWKIPDFLKLSSEIGYSIDSPEFHFGGDRYSLRLYPNGDRNGDSRYISLEVVRLTSTVPERRASCKVGYRWTNKNGQERIMYSCPDTLTGELRLCLTRSDLEKNTAKYFRDGRFCVICSMRQEETSGPVSSQSEETETSDADEKQKRLASVDELQSNYRQLLQKGAESDACIVVSGKEFRVHRCVLRVRSAVFEAMFGHETAEKESGRVVIDDLDPEIIGEFLEYLYTGSVGEGISNDNAFGLYAAADKYDVATLKSTCVAYMRRNVSLDSFCDILTLSLRHHEEDLLQRAIEFSKRTCHASS